MRVGVTGPLTGGTDDQIRTLAKLLAPSAVTELHHGDAYGVDSQAHGMFLKLKEQQPERRIEIHPGYSPANPDGIMSKRAFNAGADVVHPAKPFLDRDHDIAAQDLVIGLPRSYDEMLRSGTWATLRHAYQAGAVTLVILPDGRLKPFVPRNNLRAAVVMPATGKLEGKETG